MIRVGFDISQIGSSRAGCGNVAYSLLLELGRGDDAVVAYPTWGNRFWDPEWKRNVLPKIPAGMEVGMTHKNLIEAAAFWASPPSDIERRLGKVDVVHSNNFFCPSPSTAHRLVYTLYDLSFIAGPEWTTEANRIVCFEGVFAASTTADVIVAISEYSRAHFLQIFPFYPAERIVTFPLASRFADRSPVPKPKRFGQLRERDFWLTVGTIEPRKNHLRLLQAYCRLKASGNPLKPLVIAGMNGWMLNDFQKSIEELGLSNDVFMAGYVDEVELKWLLQNAFALCYPSLFEGFGLPPLEAMSQGTPVISSTSSSIPEVVGDAGILVDPNDAVQLAAAMASLEQDVDLATRLGQQGYERSKMFNWQAAAKAVRNAYAMAVDQEPLADLLARRGGGVSVPRAT